MIQKLLICLLLPAITFCQNTIGLPDIINYNKTAYKAGLQNWDIKQDNNGIIYIANNEGLLSFDGKYWTLYPLPNKTIVRSVEIGNDNKIYTGGQDEIGYYSPANNGKLTYTSLTPLLPEKDKSFSDVWDIASLKNDMFFRTANKIFKINNKQVTVFQASSEWSFMGVCNDRLYAHDYKNGLMIFENNVWKPIFAINKLAQNDPVTSILPLGNDSLIITTLKNGLFLLSPSGLSAISNPVIENERIYAATIVNKNWIALATNNSGVFIVDTKGTLIQSFSKKEGLQNNNILSIFLDKQSNLWLGLNNGIDFIAQNSAIKHLSPNMEDASGYAAIIYENKLYTGTSAGLFSVPLQPGTDFSFTKGNFTAVANTTGQIWGLADINGNLLMGHHEGVFAIKDNIAQPIFAKASGFWNFTPMSPVFPSAITVAGNYKGLSFLNYANQAFSITDNIPDFDESSRFVAIDKQDNIWVSHPYHGVYKLSAMGKGTYKHELYTVKNGLPSTLNNHVYKIKNEVVVATEKGVYSYNPQKNNFEPSDYFSKILGQQSIRYLKEDGDGNIWFVHEKNLGVVDMSDKKSTIINLPELNNKMLSGFESIYPINQNNIIVGGEKGFFHINYEKYKKNVPNLLIHLQTVHIADDKDSILFGGYFADVNAAQVQEKKLIPQVANHWKTIHFEFSTPLFEQQSNLEYSYRLKGFDKNWSEWTGKTEKEYTNLPGGQYTFEVKARNNLGNESAPVTYTFKMLPPWYQTVWAYLLYVVLLGVGLYYLQKRQRQKFSDQQIKYEEEQKRLQYLHQMEIDKAENELIALRNEKLLAEVDFKNSELATSAMHLVQKGELLTKLKEELNQLIKALDNEKAVAEIKRLIKVLSDDDRIDKDWEHFTQHFDKVHSDFTVGLKEKHPNISPNELKLCAYLRMNLSTKEIAQLMNISVRGVEISRYRLRKKLGLASEVSLFVYLIGLKEGS